MVTVHTSGCTLSPCGPKSLWAWWLHTVELPWPFLALYLPPLVLGRGRAGSRALILRAKSVAWQ